MTTRYIVDGSTSDLGYVRTRHLAIFRAFSLSNVDASQFLCALEAVDIRHRQYIDITDFLAVYCGEWGDQFLFLWRAYHPIAFPDYYNRSTAEQENGQTKVVFLYRKDLGERNILLKPSYEDLAGFLLFFMTLPESDMAYWLYWLWYHRPRVSPNSFSLCAFVRDFWGQSSEFHRSNAEKLEEAARKALELVIMKDFTVKSFQLYDWKTGGAWTLPLRKLHKQLSHSFVSSSFWRRVTPLVQSAGRDVHGALRNLNDAPLSIARERRLANDSRSVPEANDTGDRKAARREIRRFLRVFRTYFEMPIDDNSLLGRPSDSIFAKSLHEFKTFLSDLPNIAMTATQFKKSAAVAAVEDAEGGDDDHELVAPEDLDYKYRESLTVSITDLISRVKNSKEGASGTLARVSEDIDATRGISQAADALVAAAAKAAGKEPPSSGSVPTTTTVTKKKGGRSIFFSMWGNSKSTKSVVVASADAGGKSKSNPKDVLAAGGGVLSDSSDDDSSGQEEEGEDHQPKVLTSEIAEYQYNGHAEDDGNNMNAKKLGVKGQEEGGGAGQW